MGGILPRESIGAETRVLARENAKQGQVGDLSLPHPPLNTSVGTWSGSETHVVTTAMTACQALVCKQLEIFVCKFKIRQCAVHSINMLTTD